MSTVLQFDDKAALSAEVGKHVLAAAQEAVASHGKPYSLTRNASCEQSRWSASCEQPSCPCSVRHSPCLSNFSQRPFPQSAPTSEPSPSCTLLPNRSAPPSVPSNALRPLLPKGKFVIALSGGSLPKLLAQGLLEYSSQIDWSTWHVFFADERYVAAGHADSNLAACQEAFLSDPRVAIPSDQVYGLDHSLPLPESAAAYQANLVRVARAADAAPGAAPRFDLVMLGMGPDGHTCSLFPGHALLGETAAWVAPISDSPKPPPERITLTYPVLNAAGRVFFLATGGSKADVLPKVTCSAADLLAQGEAALPAGRVRPASGKLVWFVDTDAAAKL